MQLFLPGRVFAGDPLQFSGMHCRLDEFCRRKNSRQNSCVIFSHFSVCCIRLRTFGCQYVLYSGRAFYERSKCSSNSRRRSGNTHMGSILLQKPFPRYIREYSGRLCFGRRHILSCLWKGSAEEKTWRSFWRKEG